MKIVVGDLEADGLLQQATTVWCGVFKDRTTKELHKFTPDTVGYVNDLLSFLDTVDVLIMHNGIGYDLPLLRKLYDYEYKGKVVDTLLMSRLQNPDRTKPYNMPPSRSGPHSVESSGYRVGRGKPSHEDWSQYSPEMLHRCTEDVEIQELIYQALLAEGKGHSWRDAHMLTFKLFDILQKQEDYGWLVDKPHMERCVHTLTRWMDKIDRAVIPHLPNILVVDETKTKGEYGFVRKPFKKNGTLSAQCLNYLDSDGVDISPSDIVEY